VAVALSPFRAIRLVAGSRVKISQRGGESRPEFGIPAATHDQNLRAGELADDETEQQTRRLVGRVQVIEKDGQRPGRRAAPQESRHRGEQAEAGTFPVRIGRDGKVGQPLPKLREEPHKFGAVSRQLTAQAAWLHLVHQGAQRLGPQPVRRRAARLPAAANQHLDSPRFGLRDQLLGQAALPDPRLADHQDQPPTASARIVKTGDQLAQLAHTADERDCRRLRWRLGRRALDAGQDQRWILREDRALQLAQALAGLDAKLLHQLASRILVGLKRLRLPVQSDTARASAAP